MSAEERDNRIRLISGIPCVVNNDFATCFVFLDRGMVLDSYSKNDYHSDESGCCTNCCKDSYCNLINHCILYDDLDSNYIEDDGVVVIKLDE